MLNLPRRTVWCASRALYVSRLQRSGTGRLSFNLCVAYTKSQHPLRSTQACRLAAISRVVLGSHALSSMRGSGATRGVRALLQSSCADTSLLAERLASSGLASASTGSSSAANVASRAELQLFHSFIRCFRAVADRPLAGNADRAGKLLGNRLKEFQVGSHCCRL